MTPLDRLALLPSLPLSARFIRHAMTERPLAIFPSSRRPTTPIGALCLPSIVKKVSPGVLDEPLPLLDLEHAGTFGEMTELSLCEAIGSARSLLDGEHLVTTRLRPYLRKTLAVPQGRMLASPEWIPLRLNDELVRPRFLQLVLLSEQYARLSVKLTTGKQHPRISEDAFHRIEVPQVNIEQQDRLLTVIEPLVAEAMRLRGEAMRVEEVVNPIFHDAFGLDPAALCRDVTPRVQRLTLEAVAGNPDARFSWRYHAPEVRRAREVLAQKSRGVLAHYLTGPAVLGHTVNPANDYVAGSGNRYVTMAALRWWRFDPSPCPELSDAYLEDHASKRVAVDDILMARSGEGTIGKVVIVDRPLDGCFADFVIRLRADPQKLRPAFLRFALTSTYYQTLIFGEKKGLGNNTNIFPSQLHAFPWLDVDVAQQDEIVEELNAAEARLMLAAKRSDTLLEQAEALLTAGLL